VVGYTDPIVIPVSGTHVVDYRAVDRAGRASEWQSVTVNVPVQDPSEWIKDLRFGDWDPQHARRVVTNVQEGQAMYWPTVGRYNKIASLPDYLKGADFILCREDDAHERGDEFISFTAGTDIEVYVMKNKASHANLRGWSLVEKSFPVESGHYFRGGADIYRLTASMGTRVAIPGSAIRGEGGGNLVFVTRAASASVWITSPMPGGVFTPLSVVRYGYMVESGSVTGQSWWARYGDGEWVSVGAGVSGELKLPYTADRLPMELKLQAQFVAGGGSAAVPVEKIARYTIENKAALRLINPGPGTELLAGEKMALQYTALGMGGEPLGSAVVSWQESRDGRSWRTAPVDEAGILSVPQEWGLYWLKATVSLGSDGQTPLAKEFTFFFFIVKQYHPVSIDMGSLHWWGEHADGSVVGPHFGGKVYGFNVDHTGEEGRFTVLDNYGYHWDPVTHAESFIRLLSGGSFEYDCGAGRYKVTVVVAPVERGKSYTLTINGQSYTVSGAEVQWGEYEVTAETEAADGKVVIGGTEGLPLMKVVVERLMPDAPAVSPSVSRVRNVVIVYHEDGGEGRGRWE
jgi:hypothetical protein